MSVSLLWKTHGFLHRSNVQILNHLSQGVSSATWYGMDSALQNSSKHLAIHISWQIVLLYYIFIRPLLKPSLRICATILRHPAWTWVSMSSPLLISSFPSSFCQLVNLFSNLLLDSFIVILYR